MAYNRIKGFLGQGLFSRRVLFFIRLLKFVKEKFPSIYAKSSLMLGVGETEDEVLETMADLRKAGVSFLTIGQYLRPSHKHLALEEYVTPEKFDYFRQWGEAFGFETVASGPLVRSSYKAGEFYIKRKFEVRDGMENA